MYLFLFLAQFHQENNNQYNSRRILSNSDLQRLARKGENQAEEVFDNWAKEDQTTTEILSRIGARNQRILHLHSQE
jgi:predicted NBD/HSP70 family sugar kinase